MFWLFVYEAASRLFWVTPDSAVLKYKKRIFHGCVKIYVVYLRVLNVCITSGQSVNEINFSTTV